MTQIDFRRWGKITLVIIILYTLYIGLVTKDPFWLILGCIGILVLIRKKIALKEKLQLKGISKLD
jgi:hypothetical protein